MNIDIILSDITFEYGVVKCWVPWFLKIGFLGKWTNDAIR